MAPPVGELAPTTPVRINMLRPQQTPATVCTRLHYVCGLFKTTLKPVFGARLSIIRSLHKWTVLFAKELWHRSDSERVSFLQGLSGDHDPLGSDPASGPAGDGDSFDLQVGIIRPPV